MDATKNSAIFCAIFSLVCVANVISSDALALSPASTKDDTVAWDGIRTRLLFPSNFVSVRINQFREKELRIGYNRVLSMETSVDSEFLSGLDMVIRQATDGHRLVQAVIQGGHLKECDFSKDAHQILDFVASFAESAFPSHQGSFGDVFHSYTSVNTSVVRNRTIAYQHFDGIEFLGKFSSLVDIHNFRKKCKEFYHKATQTAKVEAKTGTFSDIYAEVEAHGLVNSEKQAKMSDEISDNMTSRNKRSTLPIKRSRSKRAPFDFSSVLIFPGTKWCGKGDLAQCYDDLGDDKDLDSCCRDHDCCPYVIPPFTSRFNLFNYRFHSLLHCDCDQRFRGCLRQSESTMANMIGKIYFNILGSKCFAFEEQEICMERAWWGGCQRYETKAIGTIRTQVSFCEEAEKAMQTKAADTGDVEGTQATSDSEPHKKPIEKTEAVKTHTDNIKSKAEKAKSLEDAATEENLTELKDLSMP